MPLSKYDIETVKELVRKKLVGHELRFKHTCGVAKLAYELAILYGANPTKALLAGYLHDYAKYDSIECIDPLLSLEEKRRCQKENVLYHSYGASKLAQKEFGINDEEVLNAIKYHVYGRPRMTIMEKIIVVSDFSEEGRTFKEAKEVYQIAMEEGLDKALLRLTKETVEYLKENNIEPNQDQYEIIKELENE